MFGAENAAEDSDLVIVGEAALLDALRQARTGRMGDIVATIQAEQDRIIRAPLGGLVVVQGGPGTGKTAVALHRAAYLLYSHRFPLEERGMLFVGPNPVFLRYVERVLPTLGESGCRMVVATDLVEGVETTAADGPEASRLKGEERMGEVVAAAVRSRQRPLRRAAKIPLGAFELTFGVKASARVVEAVQAMPGSHNARRPTVERMVLDGLIRRYGQAVERAATAGLLPKALEPDDLVAALRSAPEVRRLFERIWPVLTPERLLTDLFGSEPLLAEAGDGRLTADELALLARPRPAPGQPSAWTAADLPLIDEAAPLLGPVSSRRRRAGRQEDVAALVDRVLADALPECPSCEFELTYVGGRREWHCEACGEDAASAAVLSPAAAFTLESLRARVGDAATEPTEETDTGMRTYGHVVVDEAQDLSPMQWRMLARRCPSGSMTIVGDLGQASGHWAPGSWADVVALVPAPRADIVELTVNYRTPEEVMRLAARVLAEARPDLTPARSVRDAGVAPRSVRVGDDNLVEVCVSVAAEEAATVGDGKVAVICPDDLVESLSESVRSRHELRGGDDDDLLSAPVTVLSLDDAKGLEFDAVVVVEPAAIAAEHPHGLGALYVALTRTTTRLALVHATDLPAALGDFA